MKRYLFLAHIQRRGLKETSLLIQNLIHKENPDKIICLGDINGMYNDFSQRFQRSDYWRRKYEFLSTNPNTDPNYFTLEDLDVMLRMNDLGELSDYLYKNRSRFFSFENPKNYHLENLVRGIYPFVVSYEARNARTYFICGCEDYFDYFFLHNSPEDNYLHTVDSMFFDDSFVYFSGSDQITPSKTLISKKFPSGEYAALRKHEECFSLSEAFPEEAKFLNEQNIISYNIGGVLLLKLPSNQETSKKVYRLLNASFLERAIKIRIVNPGEFADSVKERRSFEDKVVVSHIPLGEDYNKIGSPIRVVAHGLKTGEGVDLCGDLVPQNKWTDELILNPTNIDEGKVGMLYSQNDKFAYKVYNIRS